jgi:hypothetical protein
MTDPEVPSIGYAPSEFQTKRWPSKALIEVWFPFFAGEQNGFDVYGDANTEGSTSPRLAATIHADRTTARATSTDRPHWDQDARLKPDARCETEIDVGRMVRFCLDISFHRSDGDNPTARSEPRG